MFESSPRAPRSKHRAFNLAELEERRQRLACMMMRHSVGKIPLFVMNPGDLVSDVCGVTSGVVM